MTREDILEAAAQIFRQKGYHAASMNDIAQVVNLQKPSLYHHISSKQEILLALLDQGLNILMARLGEVKAQNLAPEEKIRRSMVTYLETLAEQQDLAAVLLFEHRSLGSDLRQRHFPRRDKFERLWRDMIQEGIDAGLYACTDPGLAAKYLLGVLNWTVTWYRPDGPLSAGEIAEQFAQFFLYGVENR